MLQNLNSNFAPEPENQVIMGMFAWFAARDFKPKMSFFIPYGNTNLNMKKDNFSISNIVTMEKFEEPIEIFEITMKLGPKNFIDANRFIVYHNTPIQCSISTVNIGTQSFIAGVGVGLGASIYSCPVMGLAGPVCSLSTGFGVGSITGITAMINEIFNGEACK